MISDLLHPALGLIGVESAQRVESGVVGPKVWGLSCGAQDVESELWGPRCGV